MDLDSLMQMENRIASESVDLSAFVDINKMSKYIFCKEAYYGDGGFATGKYLVPHERELFYNNRRYTSFYKNFFKCAIDSIIDPIFANVKHETDDELLNLFIKRAMVTDGGGLNLTNAIKSIILNKILGGCCIVVMEMFTSEEILINKESAINLNIIPSLILYSPDDVVYISTNKDGIENIILRDGFTKDDRGNLVEIYRNYDYINMQSNILIKEKVDEFKIIKTVSLQYRNLFTVGEFIVENNTMLYSPDFYNLAKFNWYLYNINSELRDLLRSQGFALLCIQSDQVGNLTLGNRNVLYIPTNANMSPSFIAPPPSVFDSFYKYYIEAREEFFRVASQVGIEVLRTHTSGIAESFKFFAKESLLNKYLEYAVFTNNKVIDLFKELLGLQLVNYSYIYTNKWNSFEQMQNSENLFKLLDYSIKTGDEELITKIKNKLQVLLDL